MKRPSTILLAPLLAAASFIPAAHAQSAQQPSKPTNVAAAKPAKFLGMDKIQWELLAGLFIVLPIAAKMHHDHSIHSDHFWERPKSVKDLQASPE